MTMKHLRNRSPFVRLLIGTAISFSLASSATASSESKDYCAEVHRDPNGFPLENGIPPRPDCSTSAAQPIENLKSAITTTNDTAFMEMLSAKVRSLAQNSAFRARLYQNCFEILGAESEETGAAVREAMKPHCESAKQELSESTKHLATLRQKLALAAPRMRSDSEGTHLPSIEKVNPEVPLPQTGYQNPLPIPVMLPGQKARMAPKRLTLKPMGKDELAKATAVYDSWVEEYKKKNPPIDPFTRAPDESVIRNGSYQSGLKRFIEGKRKEQQGEIARIMREHPILSHFDSLDISDKAVAEAAERLGENAQSLSRLLASTDQDLLSDDSIQLHFLFGEVVEDVVRGNPELCGSANQLAARASDASTKSTIVLASAALASGAACSILTRAPYACFGGLGTAGAAYHWWEARNSYSVRLIALDSAVNESMRLVDLVEDLEPAERDVFFAAAMVPAPYELVAGKAWKGAYETSPLFRSAVDKMSRKAHLTSTELLNRIGETIKKKAAKR